MTRLNRRRRRGFNLVELLVVFLLAAVALAFIVPMTHRTRCEGSNRVKCASNLRQIGQAITLYANDNKGAYPCLDGGGDNPIPTWGTGASACDPFAAKGPAPTDVTAALFLLLRTQDMTSEVFICPQSNGEKDLYGGGGNTALNRANFTDVKLNLTYSYQNPYASDAAKKRKWHLDNSLSAEYAVASDINPGTTGDNQNVFAVTVTSNAQAIRQGNSANHDGDGQNVLFGDGHVEWMQNPFVGVNRDNIFTASDGKGGNAPTLLTSPYDENDSILLPTDD